MIKKRLIILYALIFLFCTFKVFLAAQNVNPDGSFSYTYQIKIPEGIGGIEPSLSLTYNSQGSNSILGMGWSLNGLPVIARDNSYALTFDDHKDQFVYIGEWTASKEIKNNIPVMHYNIDIEEFEPVGGYGNNRKSTPFVSGGNRLHNEPGTNLYHLERENWKQIEAIWVGNQIIRWDVTTKNGTVMSFGRVDEYPDADIDGYITRIEKPHAILWALRSVKDVHGKYYLVDYIKDTAKGGFYPKKISYLFS